MKKITILLFSVLSVTCLIAQQQPAQNENAPISTYPTGMYYQHGPGSNNTVNWNYAYGTKLTINGSQYRNFELTTTSSDGKMAFRQWQPSENSWTDWKVLLDLTHPIPDFILKNGSTKSLHFRVDGNGNSYISNKNDFVGNGSSANGIMTLVGQSALRLNTGSSGSSGNAGVERIRITDNGRIGIGTSTPNATLDVNGNVISRVGYFGALNPTNTNSVVSLSWLNSVARIRVGGNGAGAGNGLDIQGGADVSLLRVKGNGRVGIGTVNPSHKLDVNGTIHAREVLVDLDFPGPDYVFEEDYNLTSLSELDQYLKDNKHLPEVPSAAEMKKEGVNMVEMDMLLLKKVEELTLHLIEQNDLLLKQQVIITNQQIRIEKLESYGLNK